MFKRTKKMSKKMTLVLIALAICGVAVTATMISYYARNQSTHNVGHLWTMDENSTGTWTQANTMEELDLAWNPTGLVPGDSEMFPFNVTLSGQSNADKDLFFHITDDVENGVNLTIWNMDTDTEVLDGGSVTFTPGSTVHFEYRLSLDLYCPESAIYATALSLEKA